MYRINREIEVLNWSAQENGKGQLLRQEKAVLVKDGQRRVKGESQDASDLRGKLKSLLKRGANKDKGRRVLNKTSKS